MSKIYPLGTNPTEWNNFSNHLNILYHHIQSYEDYLNYFQPTYQILNESMLTIDANSLTEKPVPVFIEQPEWEVTIDRGLGENNPKVYFYYPSELKVNQGYLNTHYESYLAYEAPIDAHTEPYIDKTFTISQEEFQNKIDDGIIQHFPISRVIMAKEWHQQGIQSVMNTAGFNPDKYLIISKPSASWYVPKAGLGQMSFSFEKNAMENVGSLVPLQFELSPARYLYYDYDSKIASTEKKWGLNQTALSVLAASWGNNAHALTPTQIYIGNPDAQYWTGSYPLMHRIEYRKDNWVDEIITDDVFNSYYRNLDSHRTATYAITIQSAAPEEISDLWGNVRVIVC